MLVSKNRSSNNFAREFISLYKQTGATIMLINGSDNVENGRKGIITDTNIYSTAPSPFAKSIPPKN
jgi:hypothetical protein